MELFSYEQNHPFLASSAYLPSTPIEIPLLPHQVEEPTLSSSYFPYYYAEPTPQVSAIDDPKPYESSSSLDSRPKVRNSSEKKRKNSQPKGTKEGKNGKQKNNQCDGLMGEEETNSKVDDLEPTKACEDYIHVRAKRGQATDSHSLAERVRREKISERMKMLQGLVPGCEKVTGKALVLDEIINYVQSLQNQVEFLSMKLGTLNPILYEYDDCINQQEDMGSIAQPMPSVIQASSHIQSPAFQPMMDSSSPSFLQQSQGPPSATFSQNNQSFLVQIGDQRQVLFNQAELMNNMYSLHQ